jgi:uridine kinase
MNDLVNLILSKQKEMPSNQCLLVGISGIDASGKGFITSGLTDKIERKGFKAANINLDGWLNLPEIRFDPNNPAENFYQNAIRFDEMFEKLIWPLKKNSSVNLIADFAEETAAEFKRHQYCFQNIRIILLEGIFLFKKEFKEYFDLKIWVECSFEIALKRAVARAQENLSPDATIRAYETIYFPAQRIHLAKDKPQDSADFIIYNQ